MRKIIYSLFFLATPLSAEVTLKTEIQYGEKSYSPAVSLKEGEWADLSQDDILLRLNAKGHGDTAVRIKTELARIQGTEIEMIGNPALITKWEEPAEIEVKEEDGTLRYRLKVTPSLAMPTLDLKGVAEVQDHINPLRTDSEVRANNETAIPDEPHSPAGGSVPAADIKRKD